jgi:hypothetical protein
MDRKSILIESTLRALTALLSDIHEIGRGPGLDKVTMMVAGGASKWRSFQT